ncbi:hypothetical protein DL96DRAFT_1609404 [Flagelloscypha sp. PMI_526]|nr:hypothetical protein DL96DRAFT_1609404 [Flagelloscypha sp. PMI_526]
MSDQCACTDCASGEVETVPEGAIEDILCLTRSSQEEDLVQSFSRGLAITNRHSLDDSERVHPSSKQPCLNDLPDDILLRIFAMCDARTVGRLRQCCKNFSQLSTDQVVWLSVLEGTCTELNLPMPSFSQSAFASAEVELLATAWLRFQLVLRTAKDGQPLPSKTVHLIGVQERLHCFDQSPDGRFLFVLQSSGMQVWDIQTSSPTQVSSFNMEIHDDAWSHISVTFETNNSFLLYPVFVSQSQGLSQWLCFRFSFSFHAPEANTLDLLSRLDNLAFPVERWYGSAMIPTLPFLTTGFQHTSGGKYYLIWDPISDIRASWAADINDTSTNPMFLYCGDFIVILDNRTQDMFVYSRPEIPPKSSYAPEVCAWLNNPALLHVPAGTEMQNRSPSSPVNWKTLPNRGYSPLDHDGWTSILDTGDEKWLLERIEIFQADSSSTTFTPLPLSCKRSYSRHPHFPPTNEGWSGTVDVNVDQSILLHTTSKQESEVVFHLSSSTESDDGIELASGVLYTSSGAFEIGGYRYSLCPFAGRMSVATPEGIEVVDFVEM